MARQLTEVQGFIFGALCLLFWFLLWLLPATSYCVFAYRFWDKRKATITKPIIALLIVIGISIVAATLLLGYVALAPMTGDWVGS